MKNILVAIGYGQFAPQYYGYAQQLAHYFDARITLVHIYDMPLVINEYPEDANDIANSDQNKLEADAYFQSELERLNNFSAQYGLMEFGHIKIDCLVCPGDIDIELAQLIVDSDFDLLLMGMRKHRLKDQLLGNIVQKVIDNIDIPTLLIPPLANIRLVKEMVYATAFDIGTNETVDYILDWCLAFNAQITLAHVSSMENKDKAKQKFKVLSDQYHKEKKAGVLSIKLLYGDVQTALNDYIVRAHSDILVIHKRKKGFWSSIMSDNLSLELTERMNIPLLVLRNSSKTKTISLN